MPRTSFKSALPAWASLQYKRFRIGKQGFKNDSKRTSPIKKKLCFEQVESRLCLTSNITPEIIFNPVTTTDSSTPRELTQAGEQLFFSTTTGTEGLWVTNGSDQGTRLVHQTPDPFELTAVGNHVYYLTEVNRNIELWKSNGRPDGTARIAELGRGRTVAGKLTAFKGDIYFSRFEPEQGFELWRTQPENPITPESPTITPVAYLMPGIEGANPAQLTVVGDQLFFTATTETNLKKGDELWVTDGTAAGTRQVMDLEPARPASPIELTAHDGKLYFVTGNSSTGRELWMTDGTDTQLVSDVATGVDSSFPTELTSTEQGLYFNAYTADHGRELWLYDGTNTKLVGDFAAGSTSSKPRNLTPAPNGKLVFTIDSPTGMQLWTTDGTEEGSTILMDPMQDEPFFIRSLTPMPDRVSFILGADGDFEIWRTEGSVETTQKVDEVFARSEAEAPQELTAFGLRLAFAAEHPNFGNELWFAGRNQSRVVDVNKDSRTSVASVRGLTEIEGDVYFFSNDGTSNTKLYRTDSTTQISTIVRTLATKSYPTEILTRGSDLFFVFNNGLAAELWTSNGTSQGTKRVSNGTGPGFRAIQQLTLVGDDIYFVGSDLATGPEIWVTDGTNEGTRLVQDIIPGDQSASPRFLTEYDGSLYFAATLSNQEDLVRIPSPDAQVEVVYRPRDDVFARPTELTVFDGWLYFTGNRRTGDRELHRTNGTTTELVANIGERLGAGSNPSDLTVAGAFLYFLATSDNGHRDLYRTDGTEIQTVRLTDTPSDPNVGQLTNVNGKLFFSARDERGQELWMSDGSIEGTQMVADLHPENSNPSGLFVADGFLFFRIAPDQAIWLSDGTEDGTFAFTGPLREPCGGEQASVGDHLFLTLGPCSSQVRRFNFLDLTPVGDLDGDRRINANDIDAISAALRSQATDAVFDLNGDGSVTETDRTRLIRQNLGTGTGDFNLDGQVSFADFLRLSENFGSTDAGWADGDADGDGRVSFVDFLLLSANFGANDFA